MTWKDSGNGNHDSSLYERSYYNLIKTNLNLVPDLVNENTNPELLFSEPVCEIPNPPGNLVRWYATISGIF